MNKRQEFGYWIKSVRNGKGFTLRRVSESLGYKSRGTIVGVETGYTCLPMDKIHPLARIYDLPLEDLLEKIQECEPELYRKYTTLSRQIIGDFTRKVAGLHNSRYKTGEDPDPDPEYILSDLNLSAHFAVHHAHRTVHPERDIHSGVVPLFLQRAHIAVHFETDTHLRGVAYTGTQIAVHFNGAKQFSLSLPEEKPTKKRNPYQLKPELTRRLPGNVFRIRNAKVLPPGDLRPEKARAA